MSQELRETELFAYVPANGALDAVNLDFDMDNPRLQNPNTHLIDICNMMATIRLVTPWSDVSDSDPEKNLCLGLP